ncbi:Transposase [Brevibacterium sp. 239c]|nr:Transposase [Brevibacterium sp. 239c]
MENWAEIRRLHNAENVPIKEIARRLGIARNTVRAALAATEPPRYTRKPTGSVVDAYETEIRKLLRDYPTMPATVIAERIHFPHSLTVLKDRLRDVRPEYVGIDPADRLVHEPGQAAQMDLWFPEPRIPTGWGNTLMLPVLVMTLTFSRFLSAVMLPSRQSGDLLAGMWQLIESVGATPKTLIWDREAAIAPKGKPLDPVAAFAGTLATRMVIAPARDPEFKGMTERNNGYFETSFLPGRNFTSPTDFNTQLSEWIQATANTRKVRSLGARPVEKLDEELDAMTPLPPHAPTTGLRTRVRLLRDYYVRLDSNDYSVDPRHVGRLVDVIATPTRVRVTCEGQLVADHDRCWDHHQVIRDDTHVQVAKRLRAQYSARPLRPVVEPRGIEVPTRKLTTYDSVFGLETTIVSGDAEAVA